MTWTSVTISASARRHRFDGAIEVRCLEPESHAVADRQGGISNRAVVMAGLKPVQLKDQLSVDEQLFIVRTAVAAVAPSIRWYHTLPTV